MNIEVHVVSQISAFIFFGQKAISRMAGSNCSFIFSRLSILFVTVTAPTYTPKKSVQRFPFLHLFANIYYLSYFDDRHSDMEGVVLICIPLMISNAEGLLIFLPVCLLLFLHFVQNAKINFH